MYPDVFSLHQALTVYCHTVCILHFDLLSVPADCKIHLTNVSAICLENVYFFFCYALLGACTPWSKRQGRAETILRKLSTPKEKRLHRPSLFGLKESRFSLGKCILQG